MKNIVLVFPGQGSQYVGMGRELYKEYDLVRNTFEEANNVLGFDIKKMCFEGDMEELTMTQNSQPALLTVSVAAFRVYMKECGIAPAYLAGYSLGEISALTCSGAVNFDDALRIVRQRGIFMQEAAAQGIGAMSAISGLEREIVEEECWKISREDKPVNVACYNSPNQIVISGHISAMKKAENRLVEMGARMTPLKVNAPFHSIMMQPAAIKLKEELAKYRYNELAWPLISNVSAKSYSSKEKIIENLTLQMTNPVRWHESMEYMQKHGAEIAVELGAKTVLKDLVMKNFKDMKAYSFDKKEDRVALKDDIATAVRQVSETKMKLLVKCMTIAVCLQNRNWDNDEYQKGVVGPYEKIKNMCEELKASGKEPAMEEMQKAVEMLKSVFITKRVSVSEQKERLEQIKQLAIEAGADKLLEGCFELA